MEAKQCPSSAEMGKCTAWHNVLPKSNESLPERGHGIQGLPSVSDIEKLTPIMVKRIELFARDREPRGPSPKAHAGRPHLAPLDSCPVRRAGGWAIGPFLSSRPWEPGLGPAKAKPQANGSSSS
jgi:hypothetical protein